jgi:hypothetical protein
MKKEKANLKFNCKLKKDGKVIRMYLGKRKRSFSQRLGRTFKKYGGKREGVEYYLKVSYGRFEDAFGQTTEFYNDGTYTNKRDLMKAFNAFTEKDLLKSLERKK